MKRIKQTFVKSLKVLVVLSAVLLFSQCEKDDDGTNDTNNNGIVFGSLTDSRDGETYKTVKIGDQVWMAENLRTKKFNDGTEIPLVTDNSEWEALQTPAYCWYDNDEATNKATYGALYNWYTVETERLCPIGWHIPTNTEWNILETTLGMSQSEIYETGFRGTDQGSQLAVNVDLWTDGVLKDNSEFGTSGFDALPGGSRNFSNGNFSSVGAYGGWWSETEYDYYYAYFRSLQYDYSGIRRDNTFKASGSSVRCVKD